MAHFSSFLFDLRVSILGVPACRHDPFGCCRLIVRKLRYQHQHPGGEACSFDSYSPAGHSSAASKIIIYSSLTEDHDQWTRYIPIHDLRGLKAYDMPRPHERAPPTVGTARSLAGGERALPDIEPGPDTFETEPTIYVNLDPLQSQESRRERRQSAVFGVLRSRPARDLQGLTREDVTLRLASSRIEMNCSFRTMLIAGMSSVTCQ